MTNRHRPPTRMSISCVSHVKPAGPNHCGRCCGSVQALNTRSRGAAITRDSTISRSRGQVGRAGEVAGVLVSVILFLLLGSDRIALCLQGLDIGVQTIETCVPGLARVLDPVARLRHGLHAQPAGPALRMPAATDQGCAFTNLYMLGELLQADLPM